MNHLAQNISNTKVEKLQPGVNEIKVLELCWQNIEKGLKRFREVEI